MNPINRFLAFFLCSTALLAVFSACERIVIDPASMDLDSAPGVKERREAQEALRKQYEANLRVTEISDAAFVLIQDREETALAVADFVPEGAVVHSRGALTELYLFDGSLIRLGPDTRLRVEGIAIHPDRTERKVRLALLSGKAWFRVAHARTLQDGSFVVQARSLTVEAKQAGFQILMANSDDEQTQARLEVHRGEVQAVHAKLAEEPKTVTAGRTMKVMAERLGEVLGMVVLPSGVPSDSWTLLNQRLDKSVDVMENYLTAKVVSFTYVLSIHAQQRKARQPKQETPSVQDTDDREEMPDIVSP